MKDVIWPCDSLNIQLRGGTTVGARGEVVLDALGGLELRATLQGELHLKDIADDQHVTGATATNMDVDAPNCWTTRARYAPGAGTTEVVLIPRECVLVDHAKTQTWTRRAYYLKGLRCRGTTRAPDGTRIITLGEATGLDPDDHRRGLMRGLLTVSEASPSNDSGDDIRRDLLPLLWLAQRCQLTVPREDVLNGDDLVRIVLRGNDLNSESTHPLIPADPAELSRFLTLALPRFRAHHQSYELERLLFYYCRAFTESYQEARFIFAGVFMEALKFYWARNVAKYQTDVKANGLVRGFVKGQNSKGKPILYTFEELVDGVANHVGFQTSFTFIEDRNALFHTGAAGAAQLGARSKLSLGSWK